MDYVMAGALITAGGVVATVMVWVLGRIDRRMDRLDDSIGSVHERIDSHMAAEEHSLNELRGDVSEIREDVAHIAGHLGLQLRNRT